jgi:serine/threonine-protein kinase
VELHPGLPVGLNEVILTSIAKTPEQRFQSADAFRNALKSVQGSATPTQVPVRAYNPASASTAARTSQVTAPKVQPATAMPQSLPAIPAQQPAASSHRGLYMTLGALIVLAVLAAAAIYIPKRGQTSAAAGGTSTAPVVTSPTTQAPVVQQPVTPPPTPVEEVKPPVEEKKQVADNRPPVVLTKKMAQPTGGGAPSVPDTPKADAAAKAAELDAVEHEIDQLSSRAGAVNSSLDTLQRQQAASGFGLRGDMASKQSSMKNNLAKAQDAIEHNDLERAKRYSRMAESDVEALEKFLGR